MTGTCYISSKNKANGVGVLNLEHLTWLHHGLHVYVYLLNYL